MLLGIFITTIITLTIAALLSIRRERAWLDLESDDLITITNAADQGFTETSDLIAFANLAQESRAARCLRTAESAVIMGNLPAFYSFPYLPSSTLDRFLLTLRNASITSLLIFGLAGTFVKLTGLIPAEKLRSALNAGPNDSEKLGDFLTGIEGGLSTAFYPSIFAIIGMIFVLTARHWLIEGTRQRLAHSFHDFCTSTFARSIHEKRNTASVAASSSKAFLRAAESIRASSEQLKDSLNELYSGVSHLNTVVGNLGKTTENLESRFGENSPLVGSIDKLFNVASPLEERYKKIVAHLSSLEGSMAKHNAEVAKTFTEVFEFAALGKTVLPGLASAMANYLKPIADSAEKWNTAGSQWEVALTKALPAESKRIEAIYHALSDPVALLPATLLQLQADLKTARERPEVEKNSTVAIEEFLRAVEARLKGIEEHVTPDKSGASLVDRLLAETVQIREYLEGLQLSSLEKYKEIAIEAPDAIKSPRPTHPELKDVDKLITRMERQQHALETLAKAIEGFATHDGRINGITAAPPLSGVVAPTNGDVGKQGSLLKRFFGRQ